MGGNASGAFVAEMLAAGMDGLMTVCGSKLWVQCSTLSPCRWSRTHAGSAVQAATGLPCTTGLPPATYGAVML